MNDNKEYFAFISYQRKDEEWAERLRNKLEHYCLPSSVRKERPTLPKEIRPIFRDALELSGGVLSKEIEQALQKSKYLIVVCSPNSAQSPWVNKEIQRFIDLGREEFIIPFIIDGVPYSDNPETECFPPALRTLRGEKELLGININEMGRDAATVKVVARMFDLKFDALWQRYEREKKRRMVIIMSMIIFLVMIIGIVFLFWSKNKQLQESTMKIQESQSRFISEKVRTLIEEGDSYTALMLSLEVLPHNLDEPERPYVAEAEYALRSASQAKTAILEITEDKIDFVTFSHDGDVIIAKTDKQNFIFWDSKTGGILDTIVNIPPQPIISNGEQILENNEEKYIRLLEISRCNWAKTWNIGNYISSFIALNSNDSLVATSLDDKSFKIWSIDNPETAFVFNGHSAEVRYVDFSKDGSNVVSASMDSTAILWSLKDKMKKLVLCGHTDRVYSSVFNDDGKKIITASGDKTIKVWNILNGECLQTFRGHSDKVHQANYSQDGEKVVSASYDKTIKIWNALSGECMKTLVGHKDAVCAAKFSGDGRKIVSASWDNTVKIWDVETGRIINSWNAHKRGVRNIYLSPDEKYVMSISWEDVVNIWDAQSGRMVHSLVGHTGNVKDACFDSQGKHIITVSEDGTCKLWDFLSLQDMINNQSERFKNRKLTPEERRKYYLE